MIPITLSPPHEKLGFPHREAEGGKKMLFSEFLLLI